MIAILCSCEANKISEGFDDESAAILKLHHAQRDYHFEKDSISYINQLSSDFISVNRGLITLPSRAETLKRYNRYFSTVEFIKWDDVTDPIIRFSDDGSLAYTVVDKIVQVTYEDEEGEKKLGQTHFAWTAIYRKTDEGWKIECATSTNKPIE